MLSLTAPLEPHGRESWVLLAEPGQHLLRELRSRYPGHPPLGHWQPDTSQGGKEMSRVCKGVPSWGSPNLFHQPTWSSVSGGRSWRPSGRSVKAGEGGSFAHSFNCSLIHSFISRNCCMPGHMQSTRSSPKQSIQFCPGGVIV